MHRLAIGLSSLVAFAGGIATAVTGAQVLHAADEAKKKETYTPPGAEKKTLVNEPLPGLEGQQVTVDQYTFPPGWVGGWKALSYWAGLRLCPRGVLYNRRAGQRTPNLQAG